MGSRSYACSDSRQRHACSRVFFFQAEDGIRDGNCDWSSDVCSSDLDPRALPVLLALVQDPRPYTKAFAAKGLGAMKDQSAGAALLPLVTSSDANVAIEAVRSLGRLHEDRKSVV